MSIDYSKLSTPDLQALKSGDLSKVSTQGLRYIKSQSQNMQPNSNQAFPVNTGDVMALQNPVTSMAKLSDMLTGSDVMGRIKNAAQGAEQGVADLGQGAYNLADRGLHALFPNTVPLHTVNTQVNPHPNHPAYYMAGEMAPTFALPEAKVAELLGKVRSVAPKAAEAYKDLKSLPYAGRAVNFAEHLVNPAATGATYGALYNALDNNRSISSDLGSGGLLGALLGAVTRTPAAFASSYARKLANNSDIKRTPEQVSQLLDKNSAYKNVPIGDLLGSTQSSRFYNWLSGFPKSGSYKASHAAAQDFEKSGSQLHDQLLGNYNVGDIKKGLAKSLKDNYKQRTAQASQLYNAAIEHGDKNNFKLGTPNNFINTPIDWLMADPKLLNKPQIEDVLNGTADLKTAHGVKSYLGKKASAAYMNPDKQEEGFVLKQMHDALNKDMSAAMSPQTKELYNKANAYFAKEVSPYRSDKLVFDAAKGKVDNPQSLSVRLANNETPEIRKVLNDLPEDAKNLVLADRLKNATFENPLGEKETKAIKLWHGYSKLPEDTKDAVLTPSVRKKFQDLGEMEEITRNSRLRANPPLTGFALKSLAQHSPEAFAAMLGAIHRPAVAIPASIATVGGMSGLAHLMRSPALKEALIHGSVDSVTPAGSLRRLIAQYLGSGRPVATINAVGGHNVHQ